MVCLPEEHVGIEPSASTGSEFELRQGGPYASDVHHTKRLMGPIAAQVELSGQSGRSFAVLRLRTQGTSSSVTKGSRLHDDQDVRQSARISPFCTSCLFQEISLRGSLPQAKWHDTVPRQHCCDCKPLQSQMWQAQMWQA